MAFSRLFDDFPQITYSLDDGKSVQIITDVLRRVVLSNEFKNNTAFFEDYEILEGETPEDVSYRFYGTQSLHWLILMTNDVINPRFEWPLSGEQMFRQASKIYGGDNSVYSTNRAKNAKGYVVETFFLLAEESTHKNPIRLCFDTADETQTKEPIAYADSDIISDFESNFEVETLDNETYRNIRVLKPEIVADIITEYKKLVAT